MKRLLFLSFIFYFSFSAAQTHSFGPGEQLYYNVSFSGINVMRVSIRTVGENIGGRPHYHVIGNGSTDGIAKSVFDLNDTYHSWLDASTLMPTRLTGDLQENKYRHKLTYNYDWSAMSVRTTRRNQKWSADRSSTMSLKSNSGDALALFFRMRNIDSETLVKGRSYPLDLVLDSSTKAISYKFHGREDVKVRRIGTFKALKFTCTMATSDGSKYKDGMTLTVWISDDKNHIPLLMEAPVKIGKVRATLASGYKVLHPLTSLKK